MEKIAKILIGLTVMLLCIQANAQDNENPFRTPDGGEYELFDIENMDLVGSTEESDYWTRRSFTASGNFTLRRIAIMPFNPNGNNQVCDVKLYREDDEHNMPGDPLWEERVDRIPRWNGDRISENWIEFQIPGENGIPFEDGEHFSIIYKEAPGGDINRDEGWWNLFLRGDRSNTSFVNDRFRGQHRFWISNPPPLTVNC